LIGGKYRLDRLLGRGGMGSVFAAENMLTGKRVAIKCMNSEIAENAEASNRFLREAKASARIRHPNVVDVYDVLFVDDSFYLIMELLEGEPLSDVLSRETIPLPQLLQLLLGAMRGVVAAHREGVIHRDVKPENIFLAREGDDAQIVPKVLDFGISKIQGTQEIALTAPGAALGTVLYMATEQLIGAADVDARADVYAFGVILYQAITGRLPFLAESFSALVLRIMTEQPVPVRELRPDAPEKLARLIEWAMAKQRDQRLPSLDVFIHELEPFSDARKYNQLTRTTERPSFRPAAPLTPVPVMPAMLPRTAEPARFSIETPFVASDATLQVPQQHKAWIWPAAVALVGLIGLAGAGFWFWQRERGHPSPAAAAQEPPALRPAPVQPDPEPQPARTERVADTKPVADVPTEPARQPPPVPARPAQTRARTSPSGNVGAAARPVSAAPSIPPAPALAPLAPP
jgi:serine/threonine-protein kinase